MSEMTNEDQCRVDAEWIFHALQQSPLRGEVEQFAERFKQAEERGRQSVQSVAVGVLTILESVRQQIIQRTEGTGVSGDEYTRELSRAQGVLECIAAVRDMPVQHTSEWEEENTILSRLLDNETAKVGKLMKHFNLSEIDIAADPIPSPSEWAVDKELIAEMIAALTFYAEPAVYFPTRSGDTQPIWCDTDGTKIPDEEYEAPGAMARAIMAKVDPDGRILYGLIREMESGKGEDNG